MWVAALATTSRSFPTHDSGALYFSAPFIRQQVGSRACIPEARRIAANIAKLPELLLLPGRCRIFATVLKQNRALFLTTHEPCKYQASV